MDGRWRLLRPGHRVLDLGAAPGSWTLYAAERVGAAGRVLAVDRTLLGAALPAHAEAVVADALVAPPDTGPDPLAAFAPYDAVLSDLAPSTTGARPTDQARSYELFMAALAAARRLGRPGSSFTAKIFMSGDFPRARDAVRAAYERVHVVRPRATRSDSSEIYVVGLGLRRAPEASRRSASSR